MLAVDLAVAGSALAGHVLSTRFYDVAVGCAIALAGTLLVRAVARPAAGG